jgi:hypothetical protein
MSTENSAATSPQNKPRPEEVVLGVLRLAKEPMWIADLYREVGALQFCRPQEFEELLIMMVVVGLIKATYGFENIGGGKRLRICEVKIGPAAN